MNELKIVVLCGGLSTERNISFLSGSRICAALRRRGHRAVLADLYMGFDEVEGDFDPEALFAALPPVPEYAFDGQAPDLEALRRSRKWDSPSLFGRHVLKLCRAADIVFMALHGKNGEDGRVQAAFDMLGIPYTGSGHLGAAMAMDKMITKMVVGPRGVRTPAFRRWEAPSEQDFTEDLTEGMKAPGKQDLSEGMEMTAEQGFSEETEEPAAQDLSAEQKLPEDREASAGRRLPAQKRKEAWIASVCRQTDVPCVVKTPDGGSSVGVYIVRRKEDLEPAVRGCLAYGNVFMVEQFIEGREFTCGVLCGQALPSVEIVPKIRFYDYSNKYRAGATEEICPGRVPPVIEKEMGRIALQVHEIMGLSTYSRCDFMIDKEEKVWFIEVNTLPGMTQTSLVPQEAAVIGIGYDELCEKIVEDGLRIRGRRTALTG